MALSAGSTCPEILVIPPSDLLTCLINLDAILLVGFLITWKPFAAPEGDTTWIDTWDANGIIYKPYSHLVALDCNVHEQFSTQVFISEQLITSTVYTLCYDSNEAPDNTLFVHIVHSYRKEMITLFCVSQMIPFESGSSQLLPHNISCLLEEKYFIFLESCFVTMSTGKSAGPLKWS